jgi:hypothetical protein
LIGVRIATCLATCLGLAVLGAGSARSISAPAGEGRVLVGGPVLAGDGVVWLEREGDEIRLERALPGLRPRVLLRQPTRDGWLEDVAASASVVAVERRTMVCPPPNPPIAYTCSERRAVLEAGSRGGFRTVAPTDDCGGGSSSSPSSVDASGTAVALGLNVCLAPDNRRRRVVLVRLDRPGSTLLCDSAQFAPASRCEGNARVAGRFVAWREGTNAIVVFDTRSGEVASRAPVPRTVSFDLQADGTVVAAYHPGDAGVPASVAWHRADGPGRTLPFRIVGANGRDPDVRIAADRILAERDLGRGASALVVSDLAGRTTRIARFKAPVRRDGGLDLDARRVTWASSRITSSRVDCPPPPSARPCVRRATGVTTIWVAPASGGAPRVVARLPFRDVAG